MYFIKVKSLPWVIEEGQHCLRNGQRKVFFHTRIERLGENCFKLEESKERLPEFTKQSFENSTGEKW